MELAVLQPLGQHAQSDTVMPDQLDQASTTSAEGKHGAVERILRQGLLHQHRQAHHALAHIGDAARQIDTHTRRQARSSAFQRAENPAQRPAIDLGIHAHQHAARQHDLDQPLRASRCRLPAVPERSAAIRSARLRLLARLPDSTRAKLGVACRPTLSAHPKAAAAKYRAGQC